MDKHVDLLLEAECQAGYLADTVTTLRIVADALFAGLTAWKKVATTSDIADWALECSGGFYVVIRDLERIHDDLDAAVTQKYHEKWNASAREGGEK